MNNSNKIYEGKRYENNELYQLIEDFENYFKGNTDIPPVFKAKVESNPYGEGKEQEVWFVVDENGYLSSVFPHQHSIDGVDYAWSGEWANVMYRGGTYKGSITITRLPK